MLPSCCTRLVRVSARRVLLEMECPRSDCGPEATSWVSISIGTVVATSACAPPRPKVVNTASSRPGPRSAVHRSSSSHVCWRSPGGCPTCSADLWVPFVCVQRSSLPLRLSHETRRLSDGHVEDVAATWSHEDAIAAMASARRRKDKDLNTPRPPSAWRPPERPRRDALLGPPHRTSASP